MSSTSADNSNEITCTYSFNFKWTLDATQLSECRKNKNARFTLRSDIYQFKTAKDLHFYLELSNHWIEKFGIKGSDIWSFKLIYAFLTTKDRAFKLIESPQLSFLPSVSFPSVFDEENLVVHCLVNAFPAYPAPIVHSDRKDWSIKFMNFRAASTTDEVIFQNDQKTVEFDGRPNFTIPSNYIKPTVIDFIRRGDMPEFEYHMAIDIIDSSKEHMCQALKILCMEYLMSNITARNFRTILDVAIRNDLRLLERKCTKKITNGSIKIEYS